MSEFQNICSWNAASAGVGDFVVASAVDIDHATPENCGVADGKSYHYYARSADGTQWEDGFGPYSIATHTMSRTTIRATSNNNVSRVNFLAPPIVDVFPSPSLSLEQGQFPTGTLLTFQQTAAPIGWTKQTTHNDKALRVVSGAASSGGTNAFSTVMAQTVVGSTTITIGTMPSHGHPYTDSYLDPSASGIVPNTGIDYKQAGHAATTGATGGDGSHNHPILMSIQYVDLIIARKN